MRRGDLLGFVFRQGRDVFRCVRGARGVNRLSDMKGTVPCTKHFTRSKHHDSAQPFRLFDVKGKKQSKKKPQPPLNFAATWEQILLYL